MAGVFDVRGEPSHGVSRPLYKTSPISSSSPGASRHVRDRDQSLERLAEDPRDAERDPYWSGCERRPESVSGESAGSETAEAFWDGALAAAARDERIVLGAWDGEVLVGTVTLLLDCPPNQPHRAEIAKLMTRLSHRGRGVAAALMRAAESRAVERARTLLVLDTATEGGASGLYEKLGFVLAGTIPDYALKPHGGLTGTMVLEADRREP